MRWPLRRYVRWALAQLVWVGVWGVQGGVAQTSDGHYELAPFPSIVWRSVFGAIRHNDLWRVPGDALPSSPGPTGLQSLLWSGSEIRASVAVGAPTIRFQKVGESATPSKSFEVVITREPNRVIIRSSAPPSPALAAGIIAPQIQTEGFFKFIPGAGDTGFVVLMPRTPPGEWYAIALCPALRESEGGAYRFTPSGYEVASVRFEPKGEVSARLETGEAVGGARISILTTPNIPRALNVERSVRQQDPRLSGLYFPDSSDTEASLSRRLFAGIEVLGELTSPTGGRRVKQIEGVVQAQPFDLPSPVEIFQDGRKSSFQGTGCVAVVRGIIPQEQFRDP